MKKVFTLLMFLTFIQLGLQAAPFDLNSNTYPIGVYSADPATDKTFAFLKSIGVNYVHTYGMGHNTEENNIATKKFLDLAQKHGLKVMVNLMGRIWVKKVDGVEQLRQFVRKFKDHPAVGFWYLYDEPRARDLPKLRKLYSMLKQETPLIPVALVTPWIEEWTCFQEVYDILLVDLYPVRDEEFPQSPIQSLTQFAGQAIKLGKPVIVAPQIMNWETFAYQLKGKGYDEKKFRYPNFQELRYWSYFTLARGGRGLMYFSFYHAHKKWKNIEWVNDVFAKVTKEVSQFTKLTAPANRPVIMKRARDACYEMALWTRKDGEYLVLVNNWPLTRLRISRWTENIISDAELEPWGETRKVAAKIENGKLIIPEKINPWEVFVWKIKRIVKSNLENGKNVK
jgi:hypothetical protein